MNSQFRCPSLSFLRVYFFLIASWALVGVAADRRQFELDGVTLNLEEVSAQVDVYYKSMRYNRALQQWNVEVTLSNKGPQVLVGPMTLLVEGFSGTPGPIGTYGKSEGKDFYDLTPQLTGFQLSPGQTSLARTLALGYQSGQTPVLTTRVFSAPALVGAAAFTRTLNSIGQPLPGVTVEESTPSEKRSLQSDPVFAGVTLGREAGDHIWKFSSAGYLPAWRQMTLSSNTPAVIPFPRLMKRSASSSVLAAGFGGAITNGGIKIFFPPASFAQSATAILTPLDGQTLPSPLPKGWSPLLALALEITANPLAPVSLEATAWDSLRVGESAALAQFDEATLSWRLRTNVIGAGSASVSAAFFAKAGTYVLTVPDDGPGAPVLPQIDQELPGVASGNPSVDALRVSGTVTPFTSVASKVPEEVTAQAELIVSNTAGALVSGTLLRGQVSDTYDLQDGTHLVPPPFDAFIVGYQRPGDTDRTTLHARFGLRPLLLFGQQELNEAVVQVDLYGPDLAPGALLGAEGGIVADGAIRALVSPASLTYSQFTGLRRLDPSQFQTLAGSNYTVIAGFELAFEELKTGAAVGFSVGNLKSNATYVLTRTIMREGLFGLEPVERLRSDTNGALVTEEPSQGARLPGLVQPGQYLLLEVSPRQGLLTGVARNNAGQLVAGLPVRVAGQPWLTFSKEGGVFQLIAPAGQAMVRVSDLASGDSGTQSVTVPDDLAPVVDASVAALLQGPYVTAISPTNNAVLVQSVTSVQVEFSRPLNPVAVLGGAFTLANTNGQSVAASVSLNLANTKATILPNAPLDAGSTFVLTLSTNIIDSTGRALEGETQFHFSTTPTSVRDAAAQLIIYEPGATNIPESILSEIPAYRPGTNRNAIVVRGTPGTGDPDRPVILVNESTGESVTVLAKADGSFVSLVEGTEEDYISATFVNLNGTRVYIPVSRQLFDNGFVGLYRQGGILEAESDGGPVQVYIEPEAIGTRTKMKIESVSASQLRTLLGDVQPEGATLVSNALRIKVDGPAPEGKMQASFPVDLAALGFPADEPTSNAVIALTAVRETQGVKTFEFLDQMQFEKQGGGGTHKLGGGGTKGSGELAGTIFTVSGFAPGAVGFIGLVYDFVIVPALMLGTKPVMVSGEAYYYELTSSFVAKHRLGGTYVVLQGAKSPVIGSPGRLQPGWVYASTDDNGSYRMIAPYAGIDYELTATHPQFQDSIQAPVEDLIHKGGAVQDFIFKNPITNQMAPKVVVANVPIYPSAGQPCQIQVQASQTLSGAPKIEVKLGDVGTNNLLTGLVETNVQASLTGTNSTSTGNKTVWTGSLTADKPVKVMLKIDVSGRTTLPTIDYPIIFAGPPPPPTNNIIPAPDTNDVHGPLVMNVQPSESGFVDAFGTIIINFNKPIDNYVTNHLEGIALSGTSAKVLPGVRLSEDQQVLTLLYPGLEPGQNYTLTLNGISIRDLSGRPLDQRPSTTAEDAFTLNFRTPPLVTADLPSLENGRGAVISGNTLYAIDQGAQASYLLAYSIAAPSAPQLLSRTLLLGAPRDILLIPKFSYVTSLHSDITTNDLIVVVGGDLDTVTIEEEHAPIVRGRGQYLRVFDVGNPSAPKTLAAPIVTYRVGSAVTKVRWSPPYLVYQEFGADIQQIALVNLQEMLIGFGSTPAQQEVFVPGGKPGEDLNGDGDYVDVDEVRPIPDRYPAEFYGKSFSFVLQHSTQKILDFSMGSRGTLGVTLKSGKRLNVAGTPTTALSPMYRTFLSGGQIIDLSEPTNAALPFAEEEYPRWVTILDSTSVTSNGIPVLIPELALVSLTSSSSTQKLAVIDISLPLSPVRINTIEIPDTLLGGAIQSTILRTDGMIAVAGTQNTVILDPAFLLYTNAPEGQLHRSIIGSTLASGGIVRTFGATDYGVYATADGARGKVVQTAPSLSFVSFPQNSSVVDPTMLHALGETNVLALLQNMRTAVGLPPAKASTNFDIPPDLDPPNPALHFHVMMRAPGDSGYMLELGLEAVNLAGRPLANLGRGFAPVRALSDSTQEKLGQLPRPNCGAPIRSLPAYRMSDNPKSDLYNIYLSRPFVLTCERMTPVQLGAIKSRLDREILFSAFALRAFIEPNQKLNFCIGRFAAELDEDRKRIYPTAMATAWTVDASYIMGDNPPPSGGSVKLEGTYGSICAHNGELRTEFTEMTIPSRRMPIQITRTIGSQDTYEGAFGVGWDFNYNQRLTELDPLMFPQGLQMPTVVRSTKADSEVAGSQDVLFHSGYGRTVIFRWVSNEMPPEYEQDPLVEEFEYEKRVSDYYLPAAGQGVFELLVKCKDGTFERLTPNGLRYRYAANGRLQTILDRFPLNRHELEYDDNGWLVRITDASVESDRYVLFGYYRHRRDPLFTADLDMETENAYIEGKVCRLMDSGGADVLLQYDNEGFLTNRLGKLVAGENGGFKGRSQLMYQYQDCQLVGVSVNASGTPLISAQNVQNSRGKNVAQSVTGTGNNAQISVPAENSAATLDKMKSSATLPDGSKTEYEFDKLGHPTLAKTSGGGGPEVSTVTSNNSEGLVLYLQRPEGDSLTFEYDSANPVFRSRGNLLKSTSNPGPRGGAAYTKENHYDGRYNLKSGEQKDANGFVVTHELSADGRYTRRVDHGTAGEEVFDHNEYGQPTLRTDIRGVTTRFDYYDRSGFVKSQGSGDSVTRFQYGSDYASLMAQPEKLVTPEGAALNLSYNANLQQVEIRRGDLVEDYSFDEQGHMSSRQCNLGDGRQLITRHEYDARGFLLKVRNEGVEVDGTEKAIDTAFEPDDLGRTKIIKHPNGTLQKFFYDNRGNLTNMVMGDYSEEYAYDKNNNLTAVKQGGDSVKSLQYNGLNQPVTLTRYTGTAEETEEYEYYPEGQPKTRKIRDPEFGLALEESYPEIDEAGRALRHVRFGKTISPASSYTYSSRHFRAVGPRMTSEQTWSEAGFDLMFKDDSATVVLEPDKAGRLRKIERREDGATFTREQTFNDLDQITSASDDYGLIAEYNHRVDGAMRGVTNALGHATLMEHTALGEPVSRRRADGLEMHFHYDEQRSPTYKGDPEDGFRMAYDNNMRLTNTTLRSGSALNITSFDARNMPRNIAIPGGEISSTYDRRQRLVDHSVTYLDTAYELHNRYDALSRARVVTYKQDSGPLNKITYDYDRAGPLLRAIYEEAGVSLPVQYEYYDDCTRRSITYPSGAVVSENRDLAGRLIGVSDTGGNIIRATSWQGNTQPKEVQLGSTMRALHQYDVRGRVMGSLFTGPGSSVLTHVRYAYDNANNVQMRQYLHRSAKSDGFYYDLGERLQASLIGFVPSDSGYALPPLCGNVYTYQSGGLDYLTLVVRTNLGLTLPPFATNWGGHDAFLSPTLVDGFSRGTADAMGNVSRAMLFSRMEGASDPLPVAATLHHNGAGKLVRIETDDGTTIENYYRPDGQRYARKVTRGGTVVEYRHLVYDPAGQLLEEYDRSGASPRLVARYYYASSDSPDAADFLLAGASELRRFYFLKDHCQSVIAIADSQGVVQERVWYDPFGQPVIEQRDSVSPVLRRVVAGESGSLLFVFSESVFTHTNDPGPGTGIVLRSREVPNLLSISSTNGAVTGELRWEPALPGYTPYSVLRFTPTGAVTGPVSITLGSGMLEDEWGNTNLPQQVSFQLTGAVGTVYFAVVPEIDTSSVRLARSGIGNPFLFHGQYFDYSSGLMYLRARFYDPYSGMFLEPDPLGYEDSVNLYAGMRNNPVSMRDPTGLGVGQVGELANSVESGLNKADKIEEFLTASQMTAKKGLLQGDSIIWLANNRPDVRAGVVKGLQEIASKVKLESSLLGWVKPNAACLDMSIKEELIRIVKSSEFKQAVEKYNRHAVKKGLTECVTDVNKIIVELEDHTLFFKPKHNLQAAIWDFSEMGELNKYWMQVNPYGSAFNRTLTSGKKAAIHELLHMGASINGQMKQIRDAGVAVGKKIGTSHEWAVTVCTTPNLPIAIGVGVAGLGVNTYVAVRYNWSPLWYPVDLAWRGLNRLGSSITTPSPTPSTGANLSPSGAVNQQ
jgi:RHS repeat-associated protein